MKPLCIILIVLTTLALLLYPFAMMGGIMGIASYQPTEQPSGPPVSALVFFWMAACYPLPWLVALIVTIWKFRKNIKASLLAQAFLVAYLVITGASFLIWLS